MEKLLLKLTDLFAQAPGAVLRFKVLVLSSLIAVSIAMGDVSYVVEDDEVESDVEESVEEIPFMGRALSNGQTDLEDLIQNDLDILALTLPLTDSTNGIINVDLINKAKKNMVIVNTSRAFIVDQESLIYLLQQKKIKAFVHQPKFIFSEFKSGIWHSSSLGEIRKLLESNSSTERIGSKKNSFVDYLTEYGDEEISSIYCDRFFFDVLLSGLSKGMSDIDKVIIKDGKYVLVEVKNKTPFFDDPAVNDFNKSKFGWDTRRLAWYLFLKNETNLDTLYAVAHIDDTKRRNIIAWKSITINHWCNCSSWGSDTGDTQMAPYTEFSDL